MLHNIKLPGLGRMLDALRASLSERLHRRIEDLLNDYLEDYTSAIHDTTCSYIDAYLNAQ